MMFAIYTLDHGYILQCKNIFMNFKLNLFHIMKYIDQMT